MPPTHSSPPDAFALWCAIIGVLLITMALSGTLLSRLPLSTAMLYLAVGVGLGPAGLGLLAADPFEQSKLFERLAEIAVLISLFVTGMNLSVPLRDARWHVPLRLAIVSMTLTVALIAVCGMLGLGLPLGAAVLLGAILAPTDPVLASDVQVANAADRDRLRFGLSGEAGLNDGTAFPFVMLGLGLLGLHELGPGGWRWVAVDVVWAIVGGCLVGGVLGYAVGSLVLYLRVHHREAIGLDELLALGLIALAYGVALSIHAYGFLAVDRSGPGAPPHPGATGRRGRVARGAAERRRKTIAPTTSSPKTSSPPIPRTRRRSWCARRWASTSSSSASGRLRSC